MYFIIEFISTYKNSQLFIRAKNNLKFFAQKSTQKWRIFMKYHDYLNTIQNANLMPDMNFLATLRPIPKENMDNLNLPKELITFLTQIGLPSQVLLIREPEEMESQDVYTYYFPLEKFYIKKIENDTYLSIGGWKSKCIYNQTMEETITEISEDISGEYLVHITTGEVWYINNANLELSENCWKLTDSDLELQFINSSVEQFILSMACWKQFYPQFEKKYLEVDGDLEYIFEHEELYEPFLNVMELLDKKAIENELNYWRFMCDLSLY